MKHFPVNGRSFIHGHTLKNGSVITTNKIHLTEYFYLLLSSNH